MAQRRLTERQKERIGKIQEQRREHLSRRAEASLTAAGQPSPREGRVVTRHGANLAVADQAGRLYRCLFRQNLGQLVCGDRVVWQRTGECDGVVTALLPRSSVLARPDYSGRAKPIVANIDQIVIVIAPQPPATEFLIDQYLIAAEHAGVGTLIAVNKMDLLSTENTAGLPGLLASYERIGYPIAYISARYDKGLKPLAERLRAHTSILVGQSGTGKSSLIKALLPDIGIQIGRLSDATGLGRHTTSAATLYQLPSGGELIDSPGVRSFRVADLDTSDIEQGFREFRPYFGRCRFANCAHDAEPDCALREAVAQGLIAPRRLESFRRMIAAAVDRR